MIEKDAIIFPDYDDALIGSTSDGRAVYDYDQIVKITAERDEITEEEAIEYVEYNVVRSLSYLGPLAPIIATTDRR